MHTAAPSPNKTACALSFRLRIEVILSAPHKRTFFASPASTNAAAVFNPYKKPEQAAERSNAQAFLHSNLSCIMQAVEGNIKSGVTVQTIIQSISFGLILLFSRHCLAAGIIISEVGPSK